MVQQHTAGDRPDGDGQADTARPDADGAGLLLTLEHVHQHGERGGHHECGAQAHQGTEDDQLGRRAGLGGQRGTDAEHGEAAEQHLLAAQPVAEQAGGEQQTGEDERIGVDRPLQLALGRAQSGRRGGVEMVLMATFRMELSRTTISRLSISTPRIAQRRRCTASGMRPEVTAGVVMGRA
ncbi:hypothetical protein GCM10020256_55490 [Streptomyces thermocoprophilus]